MSRRAKIALTLVVISCLFWLSLLLLPFLDLTGSGKAKLSLTLIICGEAAFWLGALIVGRDLMKRYCRFLNPRNWRCFNRKTEAAVNPAKPET